MHRPHHAARLAPCGMRAARSRPRISRVLACPPEPHPQVLERDHPRPSKPGSAYQRGACLVLLTSTERRYSRYKRLSAAAVDGTGLAQDQRLTHTACDVHAIFWTNTSARNLE